MSSFAGITMCSNSIFQIGKYQGFLSLSPSPSLALVVSFLVSHGKFSGLSRALWISRSLSFTLSLLISVSRAPALSISISLFLSLALFLSRNLSFTALRSLRVSFFSYLCLFLYYLSLSLSLFFSVSLFVSLTHTHTFSHSISLPLSVFSYLSPFLWQTGYRLIDCMCEWSWERLWESMQEREQDILSDWVTKKRQIR